MWMLRLSWTERVRNNEVSEKLQTRKRLTLNNRKRQLKFLGYIMRKGGLENLILTRENNA